MNPITALLQAMGFGLDQGTALAQAMKGGPANPRMQAGPVLDQNGVLVTGPGMPGDGRMGMNDPRVGVGNRGIPVPPPRPANLAAPAPAVAPTPVLAPAMATVSAPDTTPDDRDIGGGVDLRTVPVEDAVPSTINPPPRGFLERLMDDSKTGVSPLEYALRGFTAAGSANPAQTMMQFAAQDTENEKIRQARLKANQPRVDQINGTPFFQITYPDGRTQVTSNPALAEFFKTQRSEKLADKIDSIVTQAVANNAVANNKETFKQVTEAAGGIDAPRTFSTAVQSKINSAQAAIDFFKNGGDKVDLGVFDINTPVGRDLWDRSFGKFFGTDAAAARMQVDFLLGEEILKDSGDMKGALSDKDREFLKAMRPQSNAPTDLKVRYLSELAGRLKSNEERRMTFAEQRDQMRNNAQLPAARPNSAGPTQPQAQSQTQSGPPPSNDLRARVTAAGIPFEPEKFDYRIGPNGQIQRKAK